MEEDKVSTPALYVLNNPSPFRSVHSIECHVPYRLFWWVTVCTLHGLWQCSHPYLVQCSLLWWWKLQLVLFIVPGKMPREAIKLLSGIGISVVIPEPFVFASAVIELSGATFFFCQVYTKHFLERNPTLTQHQKLIWYEDLQQGPECTQPWSLNTLTLSSSLLVMMLLNPPAPDSDYFVLNTWSFNSSLHYVCAVNWFGD